MLPLHLYYFLKPYLPWSVRVAIRRRRAKRLRGKQRLAWPIDETAGQAPTGWPGWPEGKKFALVLTHDVEGCKGLDNGRPLMELERKLGFRSSFNFVPEGEYRVPADFRQQLVRNGFEVGVHDLHHDGKLYRSHKTFRARAGRINEYLQEWGAVGFRSGYMLHKLDWLHDLHVEYDSSTFDIDPFEPQPDGVRTIFPFWVPSSNAECGVRSAESSSTIHDPSSSIPAHTGYVELPYTLVQDFTLFTILRESTTDIWMKKLDWIAAHGGMALLNTHPDYIAFGGAPPDPDQYPEALYREFLSYARQKYEGLYWQALPRQVAQYAERLKLPHPTSRRKHICMVSASIYEHDNRVMRYAQTLIRRGDSVDVIAVARDASSPRQAVIDGVRVTRLQQKTLSISKTTHFWSSLRFLLSSSLLLARNHFRRSYDLIHVHNMPDFVVFSAWLPKLTGTPVILDIHDICPEYYGSKFKTGNRSLMVRLLKRVEWLSAHFADHVIVSNHLWRDTLVSRSAPPDRCSVFINAVDTELFRPCTRTRKDNAFIIIYPGSLNWHQGLDVAIRAFALAKKGLPNAQFHIYGRGPVQNSLINLAEQLDLNGSVQFCSEVPIQQVPEVLANADLGVVPKRASDFFGNEAFSTKIMEFMSQGLPAVISRTRIDTYYYDDQTVRFFESENVEELAQAFRELVDNEQLRQRLSKNGHRYVARNSWETNKQAYLDLVDNLAAKRRAGLSLRSP